MMTPSRLFVVYFICLMMAQGQDTGLECHGMDIGDYANLSFCTPPEVSVVFGNVTEGNYSSGGDVITSLLLSGSKVGLHLLYPCKIGPGLTPSGLRLMAKAFDPDMGRADYNLTPINISGNKALWGNLENMTFAVYQPSNETAAIIFFDEGTPYGTILTLLDTLRINVVGKPHQKYCGPSGIEPSPEGEIGRYGLFNNSTYEEFMPDTEASLIGKEIAQEALDDEL